MIEYAGASSFSWPLRKLAAMIKRYPTVLPPCFAIRSPVALAEPPNDGIRGELGICARDVPRHTSSYDVVND